jgi:large subunit ribosomal protein L19e
MAADLLKVGESRVWIDPTQIAEVTKAVTKDDIRRLIRLGYLSAPQVKGVPRVKGRIHDAKRRKGRRSGLGKRHGTGKTRRGGKKAWMDRIRAQRAMLREMKEKKTLTSGYREVYFKIKGGEFADRSHLMNYLKERGFVRTQ